jgi:hypothetical protein
MPLREKSPSWGGAGGAELEGAADAERPKPREVRGTWDIVPSEEDKEVNCSKRITM